MLGDTPAPATLDYSDLWAQDAQRWNDTWRLLINARRDFLGLPPIHEVLGYVLTDRS